MHYLIHTATTISIHKREIIPLFDITPVDTMNNVQDTAVQLSETNYNYFSYILFAIALCFVGILIWLVRKPLAPCLAIMGALYRSILLLPYARSSVRVVVEEEHNDHTVVYSQSYVIDENGIDYVTNVAITMPHGDIEEESDAESFHSCDAEEGNNTRITMLQEDDSQLAQLNWRV